MRWWISVERVEGMMEYLQEHFRVGIRDRDEGKLESFGEPTRGSRDSCEDFVVVVSSKC